MAARGGLTYAYESDLSDSSEHRSEGGSQADNRQNISIQELNASLFPSNNPPKPSARSNSYTTLEAGQDLLHTSTVLTVEVQDLCYGIAQPKQELKLLLQRISFEAKPREMIAIMGASGAGMGTSVSLCPVRYSTRNSTHGLSKSDYCRQEHTAGPGRWPQAHRHAVRRAPVQRRAALVADQTAADIRAAGRYAPGQAHGEWPARAFHTKFALTGPSSLGFVNHAGPRDIAICGSAAPA